MSNVHVFFEIVYYKLNSLTLKGQSEDNNAHFALFILTLLIDFNLITVLIALDKLMGLPFFINNQYEAIALVAITYFITYLFFVRKEKYKALKEKYSISDKVQKRRINYYFVLYITLTFLLFFFATII